MAAQLEGKTVLLYTIADLLDQLAQDAKADRSLDKRAAQFLFLLVPRRYLKGSIILTSNKSYGEWGSIFSDTVLATAILERLLHTSTTLNIRGQSYRLREKSRPGVFHGLPGTASATQKED